MIDNEIIKYLEQAIDKYNKNEIFVDNIRLDKLSLDIIKRQQVEIEKYKNNCEKCGAKTRECIESLHNIIAEQQAEIKELNTIRSRLIYDSVTLTKISDELYQKIKAEAVKEFAEKLKFVWFDNRYDSPDIDFDYFVDILVETLVGDTE